MGRKFKEIEDIKNAKIAYLSAIMKIEDNKRIDKTKKQEIAKIIQETKIHEDIVLESMQLS